MLPLDSQDFEDSVLKACELIIKNDPRIGKIPKTKLRKKSKSDLKAKATTIAKIPARPAVKTMHKKNVKKQLKKKQTNLDKNLNKTQLKKLSIIKNKSKTKQN